MCLGVPGKVIEVRGDGVAVVEFSNGVRIETDANTIEGIRPGDLVVVHAGIIIAKLREEEIEEWASTIKGFIEELEAKETELLRMLEEIEGG
ncbi:MAG: HypC/HybG/HupF family hydrogenase formation chaperone [Desulfurococcales archaeon]|nr:HypC/HybG/HupF family hydrogenase formation chaperone [Desulfurococcales archaeon]